MAVLRVAALLAAAALLASSVLAQQRAPCDGLAEYPRPRFENQYWGAHVANLKNEVTAADQPGQARLAETHALLVHLYRGMNRCMVCMKCNLTCISQLQTSLVHCFGASHLCMSRLAASLEHSAHSCLSSLSIDER